MAKQPYLYNTHIVYLTILLLYLLVLLLVSVRQQYLPGISFPSTIYDY